MLFIQKKETSLNQVRIAEGLWDRQNSEIQRILNVGELHIKDIEGGINSFIGGYFFIGGNVWVNSVGFWGIYGLKQGNLLQNFDITNQNLLFVFFFLLFSLLKKKFVKGNTFVGTCPPLDEDMAWNRWIPCKIFKSLIKFYFLVFLFVIFIIKEKCCQE